MMSYLRWAFYQTKIFSVPDVLNGFDINKTQYIHHFHVIDVIQSKLLTLKHNDVVVSSKIYLTITATASLLRVSTNLVSTASNWTRHENSMNLKINVNCFCCHVYLFFHSTNYWTIWSWSDLMRISELLLVFGGIKVFYFYTTNSKPLVLTTVCMMTLSLLATFHGQKRYPLVLIPIQK